MKTFVMKFSFHWSWTYFPISHSEVVLWYFLDKKVETFLGKCQRWDPVSIKWQYNVSKTGLQYRLSPRAFPILEQPLCRAHVSISSWSLDAFLVLNKVALLCRLSELATHKNTKEHSIRNFPQKEFIGNVSF